MGNRQGKRQPTTEITRQGGSTPTTTVLSNAYCEEVLPIDDEPPSPPLPPSYKVGVYGPPGVGKSQFVNRLEEKGFNLRDRNGAETFSVDIEVDGEMLTLDVETMRNKKKHQLNLCAICRNSVSDYCIECQALSMQISADQECEIATGKCDHTFHFHCIKRWLTTRQVCPLDNTEWEFAKMDSMFFQQGADEEEEEGYTIGINEKNSVFLIIYDGEQTFGKVDNFLEKIKQIDPSPAESGKIILVANKCDLGEAPIEKGEEKAKQHIPPLPFYSVSALTGEGVEEMFSDVARLASGKIGVSVKGAR